MTVRSNWGVQPVTVENSITAAGSDVATARPLTASVNVITSAGSGTGVALPPAYADSVPMQVVNKGANTVNVFPKAGDTINYLTSAVTIVSSGGVTELLVKGSRNRISIAI